MIHVLIVGLFWSTVVLLVFIAQIVLFGKLMRWIIRSGIEAGVYSSPRLMKIIMSSFSLYARDIDDIPGEKVRDRIFRVVAVFKIGAGEYLNLIDEIHGRYLASYTTIEPILLDLYFKAESGEDGITLIPYNFTVMPPGG